MKTLHTATAIAAGGRRGRISPSDGVLDHGSAPPGVCPYSRATRGNMDVTVQVV